jgi:hypothetical protein
MSWFLSILKSRAGSSVQATSPAYRYRRTRRKRLLSSSAKTWTHPFSSCKQYDSMARPFCKARLSDCNLSHRSFSTCIPSSFFQGGFFLPSIHVACAAVRTDKMLLQRYLFWRTGKCLFVAATASSVYMPRYKFSLAYTRRKHRLLQIASLQTFELLGTGPLIVKFIARTRKTLRCTISVPDRRR